MSQGRGRCKVVTPTLGIPEEPPSGGDHGGLNRKPEHTNLDKGMDQQGFHPKDLDEQIQDPQEEPLQGELSDGPIPEPMEVSKTATAGHVEQEPSQSNYNEGDRFQPSESLSGFFSRMTVSNKTMERIMRQDSNLSPYDGFRIGGIGKVLNQIGLNQRKHHIIYKVSSREFVIPMEFTGNVMEMQLIAKEEIFEELSRLREENAVTMKWIHIGTIEVVIKATFKEGIDLEVYLLIMDIRINDLRYGCLGTMIGPIRITRMGGVDIVIKDHPVLDRTLSSSTEFGSRMSFSEDRIMGYKGKEKELLKALTPQEIRVLRWEKAFNRIMPINFRSKRGDFDAKLTHPKMQDKRKFGKVLLSFRQQGLIDSDSFYEESREEIKNLKEALQELKAMDISEESKCSLENVKRLIQRNFSENPLA
ncbi:movement protein [Sesamum angolense]|uniref:Movement protein n=1 Tax=Sesamum angolense TaxID=2727404 RepID=A0AAE1XA89_9LAMI|nr:movement protein [Sesamum angolense]